MRARDLNDPEPLKGSLVNPVRTQLNGYLTYNHVTGIGSSILSSALFGMYNTICATAQVWYIIHLGSSLAAQLAQAKLSYLNKECPLVLDTGMILHRKIKVKRIKLLVDGNLVDHPGIYRWIYNFRMKKGGRATAADGMGMDTFRFGRVMGRSIAHLKKKAEADGFCPLDMLVNIKGAKSAVEKYKNSHPMATSHRAKRDSSSSDEEESDSDKTTNAQREFQS